MCLQAREPSQAAAGSIEAAVNGVVEEIRRSKRLTTTEMDLVAAQRLKLIDAALISVDLLARAPDDILVSTYNIPLGAVLAIKKACLGMACACRVHE